MGITDLEKGEYMSKITGGIVTLFQVYQQVDDAQRSLYAAVENLAKAYADLPWTMTRILREVNSNVASGQFDRTNGDWIIQRVQEIRGAFSP